MERYKVIKTVGDGAFGTVSKAVIKATGEVVAIKRIKRKFLTWEECLELSEIRSLRKLVHPCLIKLKEVVRHDTDLHLVLEYGDKNVVQVMQAQGRPFSEAEAKHVLFDVLQGLAFMHRNNYSHRDIKPDNILMSGSRCKLIDFGSAKDMRVRPPYTAYVSTRWYRAPELLLQSPHYTCAIDIFAAGCVWAELFLMRPVFPGCSEIDQLAKICAVLGTPSETDWPLGLRLAELHGYLFPHADTTSLQDLLPGTSAKAVGLILEMLQWNPSRRPTAEEILSRPYFTGLSLDGPVPSIFPEGVQMEKVSDLLSSRAMRSMSVVKKPSVVRRRPAAFTQPPAQLTPQRRLGRFKLNN